MSQEDLYALLPFVLLALVFWLLVFRPARKRQRETMQTQANLEAGRRVMLTSGIFGDVVSVGDESVDIEIAPGTVVTAHKQAVGRVVSTDEPAIDGALGGSADVAETADADDADDTAKASATTSDEPDLPTHDKK